jgi:hypothetical protein
MFSTIQNPTTGRWVSVNRPTGQNILRKYNRQIGGTNPTQEQRINELEDDMAYIDTGGTYTDTIFIPKHMLSPKKCPGKQTITDLSKKYAKLNDTILKLKESLSKTRKQVKSLQKRKRLPSKKLIDKCNKCESDIRKLKIQLKKLKRRFKTQS